MRAKISATVALICLALLSPIAQPVARAAAADGVGVVTSNLLMYYDLGNPSGLSGTTLTELSGNFGNGTLVQTASLPSLDTSNGKFLSYATTGGYADLPDLVSASAWSGMTISFYANFGSTANAFERIMDFGNGSGVDNIEVGRDYSSNAVFIEVWSNTTSGGYCRSGTGAVNTNISGSGVIGVNTWNHWAVTIGGGYCTVYKDNVQVNQVAYTTLPRAVTLRNNYLGKSNWVDPNLEGGIGEFALYNRVLTTSELTQNFNAQSDITAPTLTSSAALSMAENNTAVGTVTTGGGSYFSLPSSIDSGKFSITNSGVLTFTAAPNFELPTDTGTDNIYNFTIRIMDSNGNYADFSFAVTVTDAIESAQLSLPSLSATPFKGISITITVTPSGDGTALPGKITYLTAGKRIVGCYKKIYSGTGNSTCTWKPAIQGNRDITVVFTPTNGNYTAATASKTYFVGKRTTSR